MKSQTLFWPKTKSIESYLVNDISLLVPAAVSSITSTPFLIPFLPNPSGGIRQLSFSSGTDCSVIVCGIGASSVTPVNFATNVITGNKLNFISETIDLVANDNPANSVNFYSSIQSISIIKTDVDQSIQNLKIYWGLLGVIGPFLVDTNITTTNVSFVCFADEGYADDFSPFLSCGDAYNINSYVSTDPVSPSVRGSVSTPVSGLFFQVSDTATNVVATVLQQGSGY